MKTVTQSQGGQNIVFGASENQYQRSLVTKSGVAEKCHVQWSRILVFGRRGGAALSTPVIKSSDVTSGPAARNITVVLHDHMLNNPQTEKSMAAIR